METASPAGPTTNVFAGVWRELAGAQTPEARLQELATKIFKFYASDDRRQSEREGALGASDLEALTLDFFRAAPAAQNQRRNMAPEQWDGLLARLAREAAAQLWRELAEEATASTEEEPASESKAREAKAASEATPSLKHNGSVLQGIDWPVFRVHFCRWVRPVGEAGAGAAAAAGEGGGGNGSGASKVAAPATSASWQPSSVDGLNAPRDHESAAAAVREPLREIISGLARQHWGQALLRARSQARERVCAILRTQPKYRSEDECRELYEALLRGRPFFGQLPLAEAEWLAVCRRLELIVLRPAQALYTLGEQLENPACYIVVDGVLVADIDDPALREGEAGTAGSNEVTGTEWRPPHHVVSVLDEGDVFGFEALQDATRRMPATVTALSAAWLARLDLAGYEQTVQRVLVQRQERTVRLLSHVPVLAGVSARVLARLAAVLVERRVERDQVVVQQGEPSDSVFFVRSGQLRVVRELEPGFFLEINQLGPHMSFGEAGVVLERPRSASVIALEQSVLLVARKLDFFRQLDRSTLQSVIRRADEGLPSDTKLRQLHRKALQWEETKRRVVREACRGRARATHLYVRFARFPRSDEQAAMSAEESIYKLIPVPEQQRVKPPLHVSAHPHDTPPTASTFGLARKSVVPVSNVGGAQALPKKHIQSGALWGRASEAVDPKSFLKHAAKTLPEPRKFSYEDTKRKPPVPHVDVKSATAPNAAAAEKPKRNFVAENAAKAVTQKPPKPQQTTSALERASFGKVPEYLQQVKAQVAKEESAIREVLLREQKEQEEKQSKVRALPEEERQALVAALEKKREEVNRRYQTMTHMVVLDTVSKVKRKEEFERELAQLDKGIEKLSKRLVFVSDE